MLAEHTKMLKSYTLYLAVIIGIFSYEKHLYEAGLYIILSALFLIALILVSVKPLQTFKLRLPKIEEYFLFAAVISSALLFKSDSSELFKNLVALILTYCITSNLQESQISTFLHIFERFFFTIALSSFAIVYFQITPWWQLVFDRFASILFDPNFFATLAGFAILILITDDTSTYLKLLRATAYFIMIWFSFSKAGILSIGLVLLLFSLMNRKIYVKYLLLMLTSFALLSVTPKLIEHLGQTPSSDGSKKYDTEMLRLNQGLNYRDKMWREVIKSSISTSPFHGKPINTFGAFSKEKIGVSFASSHNFFIDFLYRNGLIAWALLLLSFGLTIWNIICTRRPINNTLYSSLFIFGAISSCFITFSIGGIGLLSAIYSISFNFTLSPSENG